MKKLITCLALLLLVIIGCRKMTSIYLIPESNYELEHQNSSDLELYTWIQQTNSPPMIISTLKIETKIPIQVDFSEPRIKTSRGNMIVDFLSIVKIDPVSGAKENIVSISGVSKENSSQAQLSLEKGIYTLTTMIFMEYHPELLGETISTSMNFGTIIYNDESIVLNDISYKPIENNSDSITQLPPGGSKIR